jgi:hypothetical protein
MKALGRGRRTETVGVGSTTRVLDLQQDGVDPAIAGLKLAAATKRLRDALADLPELAKPKMGAALGEPHVTLELDHDEMTDFTIRPELPGPGRLPDRDAADGRWPDDPLEAPRAHRLDPLTVVDDGDYLRRWPRRELVTHSARWRAIGG